MNPVIPHYIGGQKILGDGPQCLVYNPSYGIITGEIHCADLKLIRMAIQHAEQAQPAWAQTPAIKRAQILRKFSQCLEQNEEKLANIVSQEHGKTVADAKASIQRGLELVHYHSGIQQQSQGLYSHQVSHQVNTTSFYQALGICAGIAPFNFPTMVPLWLLIPAIACGNAFILKPSEKTPSASLHLVTWLEECGLPPGIAQCVHGDAQTVQTLLEQPEIQAFSAVGSSKAAQHIYMEASKRGKRCASFGGAKNHAVLMPDANLEHATDAIISAAFGSAGQRCMAISTVITIDQSSAESLKSMLIKKMKNIKIGPGDKTDTDMGPLISQNQVEHLKHCILEGIKEGAELSYDGRECITPNAGFYLGPCLFDHVTTSMQLYQQELFGPILIIVRLSSLDEALTVIKNSPYGNGAVIFTQDGQAAQTFIDHADAGMVGVNIAIPVPIVSHPFGGWKQSSFGSHPMHALDSIRFYTKHKSVTTTWPKNSMNISFNMPHL